MWIEAAAVVALLSTASVVLRRRLQHRTVGFLINITEIAGRAHASAGDIRYVVLSSKKVSCHNRAVTRFRVQFYWRDISLPSAMQANSFAALGDAVEFDSYTHMSQLEENLAGRILSRRGSSPPGQSSPAPVFVTDVENPKILSFEDSEENRIAI